MTTDTKDAPETPKTSEETTPATGKTTKKTTKKKRTRKLLDFVLTYEDVTGEFDDKGNIIPGTERRVWVEMPMPPGLDESEKRNRKAIDRAIDNAVFKLGLEEYGNKNLRVQQLGEIKRVEFVKTKVTKLVSPEEAEKLKDEEGVNVVIGDDAPESDASV